MRLVRNQVVRCSECCADRCGRPAVLPADCLAARPKPQTSPRCPAGPDGAPPVWRTPERTQRVDPRRSAFDREGKGERTNEARLHKRRVPEEWNATRSGLCVDLVHRDRLEGGNVNSALLDDRRDPLRSATDAAPGLLGVLGVSVLGRSLPATCCAFTGRADGVDAPLPTASRCARKTGRGVRSGDKGSVHGQH